LATDSQKAYWFFRSSALFDQSGDSTLSLAAEHSDEISFHRGQLLEGSIEQAPAIYLLREGRIKLCSYLESGKEIIQDIAGEGDVIGPLQGVVPGNNHHNNHNNVLSPDGLSTEAIALSDGVARRFGLKEFRHMVDRHASVMLSISRMLGMKQQRLQVRLNRLLFRTSIGKLAGLLAELAERYGEDCPQGRMLTFRLTHQEMASMIGVKRETVSECLAKLEYDELIAINRRVITVLDPEKLDSIL